MAYPRVGALGPDFQCWLISLVHTFPSQSGSSRPRADTEEEPGRDAGIKSLDLAGARSRFFLEKKKKRRIKKENTATPDLSTLPMVLREKDSTRIFFFSVL